MCSYERAAWLGYRDLGFPTGISVSRLENFAIWTLHSGYRDEFFATAHAFNGRWRRVWWNIWSQLCNEVHKRGSWHSEVFFPTFFRCSSCPNVFPPWVSSTRLIPTRSNASVQASLLYSFQPSSRIISLPQQGGPNGIVLLCLMNFPHH